MATEENRTPIESKTIFRLFFGVYPSMAMLAGMQLDLFTPLAQGPMSDTALARALGVDPRKLRPLLDALVHAGLLTVEGEHFANTPEASRYLVRGLPTYVGSAHELLADLWRAALEAGASIRAGAPQAKHDFATMSEEELGSFFRGLHAGALAVGRQLAAAYRFDACRSLADVGGGSGGLAIAACQSAPALAATVIDLPRVAPIARSFIDAAGLAGRVKVAPGNIVEHAPEGRFDVAVLRNLLQVLGPGDARRALRNIGAALEPGGTLLIVGHVLEDSRLAPASSVGINLVFLSIYDEGRAHTEGEHRRWLAEAGFADIDVRYGAASGGATIISARRTR